MNINFESFKNNKLRNVGGSGFLGAITCSSCTSNDEIYCCSPWNFLVIESSLVPGVPNGVENVNQSSSHCNFALRSPPSIANVPKIIYIINLQVDVKEREEPRPNIVSKFTLEKR